MYRSCAHDRSSPPGPSTRPLAHFTPVRVTERVAECRFRSRKPGKAVQRVRRTVVPGCGVNAVRRGCAGCAHMSRTCAGVVVRAPIEIRSTDRPSSTVRVKWPASLALAASINASVAASPRRQRDADQVERVRRDDLEPVVVGDPLGQLLGHGDVVTDHPPGTPRRPRSGS